MVKHKTKTKLDLCFYIYTHILICLWQTVHVLCVLRFNAHRFIYIFKWSAMLYLPIAFKLIYCLTFREFVPFNETKSSVGYRIIACLVSKAFHHFPLLRKWHQSYSEIKMNFFHKSFNLLWKCRR
jgi:hypothetical protein